MTPFRDSEEREEFAQLCEHTAELNKLREEGKFQCDDPDLRVSVWHPQWGEGTIRYMIVGHNDDGDPCVLCFCRWLPEYVKRHGNEGGYCRLDTPDIAGKVEYYSTRALIEMYERDIEPLGIFPSLTDAGSGD